ncbi:MAG: DMT family transporter [Parvibaculaceae bacterium]
MNRPSASLPPTVYFLISAVFHYLGPSFAVLLFAEMSPLGVAWLRIASAALVFALWLPPWRAIAQSKAPARRLILLLGAILGAMNMSFYLAIERLPLATVAAIEFAATIAVALIGLRSARNVLALGLAVAGVMLLAGVELSGGFIDAGVLSDHQGRASTLGLGFAFANALLFALYVVVGHAVARQGGASGIARLGSAMAVAFLFASPFGLADAAKLVSHPLLILAGIGVGISSSVIPYVCDQLAMARLPRASFALMLTLLPAIAAVSGALVLGQVPGPADLAGIALVVLGVGLHRPAEIEGQG